MMHRTATVDYIVVVKGEIYAVMEKGETLLRAGDVLVQRGTNHSWSVRGNEPCTRRRVLVNAEPLPKKKTPSKRSSGWSDPGLGRCRRSLVERSGFKVHGYDIVGQGEDAAPSRTRRRLCPALDSDRSGESRGSRAKSSSRRCRALQALHSVCKELNGKGASSWRPARCRSRKRTSARDTLRGRASPSSTARSPAPARRRRSATWWCSVAVTRLLFQEGRSIVLKAFSSAHHYLGEFGNGSRMKFVANLMVAIHNVSAAEAFALGMKAGPLAQGDLRGAWRTAPALRACSRCAAR